LIQKIYEADPLTCPKCQGKMSLISFIENKEVIEKILKHLGLWDLKPKPPPRDNKTTICCDVFYLDIQAYTFLYLPHKKASSYQKILEFKVNLGNLESTSFSCYKM